MIEILEKYGFKFRGTCDCAGPKSAKYKNGDYTVYWSRGSKKFRIKHHGKPVTTLLNEQDFETEIKKHIQIHELL